MKPSTTAMVALLAVGLASTACGANDEGATRRLGSGAVTSVPVTVAAAPGTTAPPVTNAGPAATSTVPAVAAPPLSSSSRLRIDGLGPVEVGMTVAQVRSAAGVELSLDHLPLCDVLTAPRGPTGVSLMVTTPASGRVALIIVNGGSTATISGIRVGSTEAEVLAAYPGRLRLVNPLLPVHRLIFEAADAALADRALVFVIDNSRVATMHAGSATRPRRTRPAPEAAAWPVTRQLLRRFDNDHGGLQSSAGRGWGASAVHPSPGFMPGTTAPQRCARSGLSDVASRARVPPDGRYPGRRTS